MQPNLQEVFLVIEHQATDSKNKGKPLRAFTKRSDALDWIDTLYVIHNSFGSVYNIVEIPFVRSSEKEE